jgi:hypothetical protein
MRSEMPAFSILESEWENFMKRKDQGAAAPGLPKVPRDWAVLILKLRWIGLDEEADRLQLAVSTLPPQARCGASLVSLSAE